MIKQRGEKIYGTKKWVHKIDTGSERESAIARQLSANFLSLSNNLTFVTPRSKCDVSREGERGERDREGERERGEGDREGERERMRE